MYDDNELLDLLNKDENIVGTVKRAAYYKNPEKYKGLYLRAAELFIQNDKGQLWIPRRNAHKKVAPNGLDYSAGGHVGAGEDYATGLIREIDEELNLVLQPKDLQLLHTFTPATGDPYFRGVFLHKSNKIPEYNKDDFSEYYWLYPQELIQKLEAGESAKVSMLETVRVLQPAL